MTTLRKIFSLARPYGRKRLGMVAAMTVLQGVMQTVGVSSIFPFLALASDTSAVRESMIGRSILGSLPEMSDRTLLVLAGLGAIGMMFAANGLQLLTVYATSRYTRGFGHWLRVRLLRQMAGQDYSYFLQHSTAVMLKKVNGDVLKYIQSVLMPMFNASASLINVVLLSLILIWIDPWIAFSVGIVLGGVYIVVYSALGKHRLNLSQTMQRTGRSTNRLIQQLLGGIKPIKVHAVEEAFIHKFSQDSFAQAQVQAKQTVYMLAPKFIIEPMGLGAMVAIVLVYVARGDNLVTVLPTLGLMAMAAYRMLPNIQTLYGSASIFSSSLYSLDEVYDEFHGIAVSAPARMTPPEKLQRLPLVNTIRLDNVCFRYPTSTANVIESVSLTIPKNTSVAFVGTTGCGKSTLVDLILGLHTPVSGQICIDDLPLDRTNCRHWRRGIGYVPQDIFLLDDTVQANIAIGVIDDQMDQAALRQACAAAQILEFIERDLPDGFATEVGERGVRLSGGQRQRIGLARALYHRPDVLILDEATSALDNTTEADVMHAIEELEGEITMIIVAHRLTTIHWCDQVIELDHGRVVPRRNDRLAARN